MFLHKGPFGTNGRQNQQTKIIVLGAKFKSATAQQGISLPIPAEQVDMDTALCSLSACSFTSDCHPIRRTDGERISTRLVFSRPDASVYDRAHMSADIPHPIDNNGWSDQFRLKNAQADLYRSTGVKGV